MLPFVPILRDKVGGDKVHIEFALALYGDYAPVLIQEAAHAQQSFGIHCYEGNLLGHVPLQPGKNQGAVCLVPGNINITQSLEGTVPGFRAGI